MTSQRDVYERLRTIAQDAVERAADLTRTITEIPSPSGDEQRKAEFVADLLNDRGYDPQIDDVHNVVVRRGDRGGRALMLLAHTDTVFPSGTNLATRRTGDRLYGPSIGDNSLGVAAMLTLLDLLDSEQIETDADVIAVANVGEEGLGNLRGARAAVDAYFDQLGAVIAVEGHNLGRLTHAGVGSIRFRVIVNGPGGHSWGAFGTPSAIHHLGEIIADIAKLRPPAHPRTSFNVGVIDGGTSVNTIAAQASAIIDLRSIDAGELAKIHHQVMEIIERHNDHQMSTSVETLGERPAASIAVDHPLISVAKRSLEWVGLRPELDASSTDANIPLSRGIPAVCIGITRGGRGHTVEEYIEVPPIADGLAQLARLTLDATSLIASAGLET